MCRGIRRNRVWQWPKLPSNSFSRTIYLFHVSTGGLGSMPLPQSMADEDRKFHLRKKPSSHSKQPPPSQRVSGRVSSPLAKEGMYWEFSGSPFQKYGNNPPVVVDIFSGP